MPDHIKNPRAASQIIKMNKRLLLTASIMAVGAIFMGGGSNARAATALAPQGDWAIARIDGNANTADSYCALSRPFNDGVVLTLGRNAAQEYSLAIDFQAATLDVDKAYSLTLQPSPGQIRAYEMMPASQRAMVVRLGYDESFIKGLQKSGLLKAELDGKDYEFQMSNFEAGNAKLNDCLSGLKGAPTTQVADAGFAAEKVPNPPPMPKKAEPKPEVKPAPAPVAITAPVSAPPPPAPIAKAAPPAAPVEAPQMDVPPPPAPKKATPMVEMAKVESKAIPVVKAEAKAEAEAEALQAELATPVPPPPAAKVAQAPPARQPFVSRRIEMARVNSKQVNVAPPKPAMPAVKAASVEPIALKAPETSQPQQAQPVILSNNDSLLSRAQLSQTADAKPQILQTQLQKQQRDAVALLEAENRRLNQALQAEVNKPSSPDRTTEVSALQNQINQLQSQLAAQQKMAAISSAQPDPIDEKIQADLEALRQENQKLRQTVQTLAVEKSSTQETPRAPEGEQKTAAVDPEVMKQLDNLRQENARLSSALQGQEQKLAAIDSRSPEAEAELKLVRAQLQELKDENKRLFEESKKARGEIDTAVVETSNQALQKMREYERKLDAAKSDNIALAREIEELRQMKEDKILGAVSGDWDLEKSTKRYNEAEREIKRLGMLLEQQRLAHRQEKVELEQMLFDPAVTDDAQRKKLTELEMQLAAAEAQLQASGQDMRRAPLQATSFTNAPPRSPLEERVTISPPSTVSAMPAAPAPVVQQQAERLEITRLNNQIERQSQQIQAYSRANDTPRVSGAPAPRAPLPQVSATKPSPVAAPRAMASSSTQFSQADIQALLSSTAIPLSSNVVSQGQGKFRWQSSGLVGAAQIVPLAQAGSVEKFAQNYMAQAKKSCAGDFASLPAPAGKGNMQAYEIACINASRSTSSSVVFTQKGNEIIAISHDAPAENMDSAIDARDRIIANL